MDNEILKILAQILPPIIGVLTEYLTTMRSDEIIRGIKICDDYNMNIINEILDKMYNKMSQELNRILLIKSSEINLDNIGKLDPQLNFSIDRFLINRIEDTFENKKKFNRYLNLASVFRWIFYILICLGLLYILCLLLNQHFIPDWYVITISIVSIMLIALFFLYQVLLKNHINKFSRIYGIPA